MAPRRTDPANKPLPISGLPAGSPFLQGHSQAATVLHLLKGRQDLKTGCLSYPPHLSVRGRVSTAPQYRSYLMPSPQKVLTSLFFSVSLLASQRLHLLCYYIAL